MVNVKTEKGGTSESDEVINRRIRGRVEHRNGDFCGIRLTYPYGEGSGYRVIVEGFDNRRLG